MIRVGVIRGGVSPEYDISLKTGSAVLNSLNKEKFKPIDILITRDGEWHMNGLPVNEDKLKMNVDIIWNGLHGHFGEDGKLQKFLDQAGIPYVGSGALPAALTHNKMMAREELERLGYKVPRGRVLRHVSKEIIESIASDIFRTIVPPWVVKPLRGGSSIGVTVAYSYDDLMSAIESLLQVTDEILVEEYVFGRELFTGVVEGMRNQEHYSFPVFCVATQNKIFCTDDRTGGTYSFLIPKDLSPDRKQEIENHARRIHKSLGLSGYSSIDFIDTPKGLYVLEIDSYPALHEHAPFARALEETGTPLGAFLEHMIARTLKK